MARKFKVRVNGKEYLVEVEEVRESPKVKKVAPAAPRIPAQPAPKKEAPVPTAGSSKEIKAPMSGVVVRVLVEPGREIKVGDPVIIFEAMKMENQLRSPSSGKVKEVLVKEGDTIETGQVVVVLE